jgi:transposase
MRMLSMNAYSKDLRLRVLAAVDRGIPRKEVADLFGVSLSSVKRCSYIQGWAANFLGYAA